MQECSSISYESNVNGSGDVGGLFLTIFLFLLQKIDTTLKYVCLLLTVIYDHTRYGNVHLQMTAKSALFGHQNHPFLHSLRWRIIPRTLKEIILMNINAYCAPLNKSTDQAIKLRLPSYLLITTGFSFLQHKKGNAIHMCTHILYT